MLAMLSGATREGSPPEHCDVRLRDYALNYLARFPASVAKLRIVLSRRARLKEQILTNEGLASLIGELRESGYVDDERFALARTRSLLRRGASLLEIRSKLARDGIAASQIKETLASFVVKEGSEALELVAAMRVARKRAIGPSVDLVATTPCGKRIWRRWRVRDFLTACYGGCLTRARRN